MDDPLADGLTDHYGQPDDPASAALLRAARGFVPDPQSEAAVATRALDAERFDRDYRAMGGDPLALSLYIAQREASIAVGAFSPEGDPA